ncbi:MAG: hypothetical protein ACI9TH_004306 [Kiritimatiellia bacterium]|jgi:hypothetical protein
MPNHLKYSTCLSATIYAILIAAVSGESKLKSFERSATGKSRSQPKAARAPSPEPQSGGNTTHADPNIRYDRDEAGFFHYLGRSVFRGFAWGGYERYSDVSPEDVSYVAPNEYAREAGSPRIPFARLDLSLQEVDSNLEAMNYRLEGGLGPIALQVKRSEFEDKGPDPSRLDITQWHVLYRMSLSPRLEWDIGLGSMELDGGFETSGASITLPIAYHAPKYVSIELRPAWADFEEDDVVDIELAAMLNVKYASLRGGYRWLEAGDIELSGPFAGISLQW